MSISGSRSSQTPSNITAYMLIDNTRKLSQGLGSMKPSPPPNHPALCHRRYRLRSKATTQAVTMVLSDLRWELYTSSSSRDRGKRVGLYTSLRSPISIILCVGHVWLQSWPGWKLPDRNKCDTIRMLALCWSWLSTFQFGSSSETANWSSPITPSKTILCTITCTIAKDTWPPSPFHPINIQFHILQT